MANGPLEAVFSAEGRFSANAWRCSVVQASASVLGGRFSLPRSPSMAAKLAWAAAHSSAANGSAVTSRNCKRYSAPWFMNTRSSQPTTSGDD